MGPFWSSSILVVFHFGRLPFWSSSILVIFYCDKSPVCKFLNISPVAKGLLCLLLGGTARLLAGAIIIAVPSLAIIAEPVPIVRLHPSHYITRPPSSHVWICMGKWTSEKL